MLSCHYWSSFSSFRPTLTDQLSFCNTTSRSSAMAVSRSARAYLLTGSTFGSLHVFFLAEIFRIQAAAMPALMIAECHAIAAPPTDHQSLRATLALRVPDHGDGLPL